VMVIWGSIATKQEYVALTIAKNFTTDYYTVREVVLPLIREREHYQRQKIRGC